MAGIKRGFRNDSPCVEELVNESFPWEHMLKLVGTEHSNGSSIFWTALKCNELNGMVQMQFIAVFYWPNLSFWISKTILSKTCPLILQFHSLTSLLWLFNVQLWSNIRCEPRVIVTMYFWWQYTIIIMNQATDHYETFFPLFSDWRTFETNWTERDRNPFVLAMRAKLKTRNSDTG